MKKFLLVVALFLPLAISAQNDTDKKLTKFEQFTSKTGCIYKSVDVKTPFIKINLIVSLATCIHTLIGEESNSYFYKIEDPSSGKTAMIEYSDLIEINKALNKLVSEVDADCATNPDYLENHFVTNDGFQIGYYVSGGKPTWFLELNRFFTNSIFSVKNAEILTTNFFEAQKKIEELKVSYNK